MSSANGGTSFGTLMVPLGITTTIGTILPSARRLSRIQPAAPTPGQEASLSPPPWMRYSTGSFALDFSYPDGVQTCKRRISPRVLEK